MSIREERSEDFQKVWHVNTDTFEKDTEANLVNALRNSGIFYIFLVAEEGDKISGQIPFTPVALSDSSFELKGMGLGPMAVVKNR